MGNVSELLNSSGSVIADTVVLDNSTLKNVIQQHPVHPEDDTTYPGLEKEQLPQQELR